MIVETGRVTHITNGKAVIEIEKETACAQCHVGCVCDLGKRVMVVEATDPIGVRVDQVVQLAIPSGSALRASFAVYGVPLLALIFGTLLGEYLGTRFGIQNVFEILVGFGFLGLSLIFVRSYDQIFRHNLKNQPVITKIVG
jgi:sigma-E factor negative regulatory protein RseC